MNRTKLIAAVLAMSMSFSTVPFANISVHDNAVTVSAASTEQVNVLPSLKATDKSNAVCYSNLDEAAFHMDGRSYYQGVVLTGKSSITFNVEDINKLSWKLGHVDNTDKYNMTMKVYLDDELADSVPISWYMLAIDYDIDVSKASKLKIVMEGSNYGSYAMGDVCSDKESPSVTAKAREYSKVGDILAGCFDSSHINVYQGNDKTAGFNMNGRTYHQGIVLTGSYSNEYTTVSMNIEGISKLSWTIGHVDNAARYNGKINVYVDDELTESRNLTWNMNLEEFELDLPEGSKVIRIELEQNSNQYAIADIKADSLDAGIECNIPSFLKASAFIDSGFNKTNVTKYTGSSKADSFNVNGRTYYQGLAFKYTYSTDIPTVTYNVENIDKMSFNIGRVDNSGAQNGILYIYRDNEEYDAIPLKAYMPISDCEVDLKGTKNLRFVLKADSQCTYALMNIHADALAPEIDYTQPKYEKVNKFIDSIFNTNYINTYNGSTKADYYNMNGRTYYEGIIFTGDYSSYDSVVCMNVEDVNNLSWTIGHLDNSGYYNGTMYVYLDEELVDKLDLQWWMKVQDYSIDVSKGNVLRVYFDRNGGTKFALADIAADDRKTSNSHVVPKYETAKDFLKSGYNSDRVTIYNGESPKINKFFMNGNEYSQGIRYYGEYSSYDSAVSFNTENINSINFKIGHVDETGKSDAKLIVYINGVETESIPLKSDMIVTDYTIDTSEAEYIRFYLDREGGSEYAMADINLVGVETNATTTTATTKATETTTTTAATTTTKATETTTTTAATTTTKAPTATTTTAATTTTKAAGTTTTTAATTTTKATETTTTTAATTTTKAPTTTTTTAATTTTKAPTATTTTAATTTTKAPTTTTTTAATTTTKAAETTTTTAATTTTKAAGTTTTTASTTTTKAAETTTTTAPVLTNEQLFKNADVDDNGQVDAIDASLLQNFLVNNNISNILRKRGLPDDATLPEDFGDANGDGKTNVIDMMAIIEYYATFSRGSDVSEFFINLSKTPRTLEKSVTISQEVASGNENDEYCEFVLNMNSESPITAADGILLFNGNTPSEAGIKTIEDESKKYSLVINVKNGYFNIYSRLQNTITKDSITFRVYGVKAGEYSISYDNLKFYGTDGTEYSGYTKKDFAPFLIVNAASSENKRYLGDVDSNGLLDAVDASKILANYAKYSTGTATPTEDDLAVCDVNKDGYIDAVDASKVLAFYAHISTGGKLSFEEFMKNKQS